MAARAATVRTAAIPLRSPSQTPARAVPGRSTLPGKRAGRETAAIPAETGDKKRAAVWAALRLEATISFETGIYLVAP